MQEMRGFMRNTPRAATWAGVAEASGVGGRMQALKTDLSKLNKDIRIKAIHRHRD